MEANELLEVINSALKQKIVESAIDILMDVNDKLIQFDEQRAAYHIIMAVAILTPTSPMPKELRDKLNAVGLFPESPEATPEIIKEMLDEAKENGYSYDLRQWDKGDSMEAQQTAPSTVTKQ